jgi:hypothetical protein|nr:MAG TPA: hypothetical protein [Crassvirales sp.]
MLHYNIIVPNKLTMESLIRLSNNIASNQRLDDDIIHNYEDMKHFDLEHHAINRHDRRVIKSKYRKLNKRRNGRKL